LFEEPDSPENIQFEAVDGDSGVEGEESIAGATIYKLIQRLTYHKYTPDPLLMSIFLFTYRAFLKPKELLELIILRYYMHTPKENADNMDVIIKQRYVEGLSSLLVFITDLPVF
jgi:hypothetical protein